MTILHALLGEHGVLYAQFAYLEQRLDDGVPLPALREPAALLASALQSHANLEDELLFVALEPFLGVEAGPLAVMRAEHDEIEGTLQRISLATEAEEVERLLWSLLQVARDHFAKEEHVLFPLAEQFLEEETLARLGRQWAQRRGISV